jgi:hypothetical protein
MVLDEGVFGSCRVIFPTDQLAQATRPNKLATTLPNSLVGRAGGLLETANRKYYVSQAKPRIVIPKGLAIFPIGDIRIRSRRVLAYGISPESSKSTMKRYLASLFFMGPSHCHFGIQVSELRIQSTEKNYV